MRAIALIVLVTLATPAAAEQREVIGYAGVLGEWELTATVTQGEPARAGEFSGAVTFTHVGLCSQDGPEKKSGEIRLQMSASRLNAKVTLAGVECAYSAQLSDAYKGYLNCPGQLTVPFTLWVR